MAELDTIATSATVAADDVSGPPLDWNCVVEAAEAVAMDLGWSARITAAPAAGQITVHVPGEQTSHVARTTLEFYTGLEARLGVQAFARVGVEFTVV